MRQPLSGELHTELFHQIVGLTQPGGINQPYEGGYILAWISKQYPSVFTFSMEINKKRYLSSDRLKFNVKNTEKSPGKIKGKVNKGTGKVFINSIDGDIKLSLQD